MMELPDWTAFTSSETDHRGLDPLGLAAIGSSIVQKWLLPGITNTTRHIRYYSFFCWVFWEFWRNGKREARLSEQRKWRARLENVLRAATLWKAPHILGLVGRRKAVQIEHLSPRGRIRIDSPDVVSAFIPAFYSSSFRALGCGKWTTERGAQLTAFGGELAKAFDLGLRRSTASQSALSSILTSERTASVGAVRTIADAIRIRQVEPTEPEHSLLLELLLRLGTGENQQSWQARSRSFALLMEIVEQAPGKVHSSADVHRVFATGRLPTKKIFSIPRALGLDFEIWKRYQERQYVKLSIYSLWHEVVQLLDYHASKTASVQQLLSHFRGAFAKSSVALKWLGPDYVRLNVGKVQELLDRRLHEESIEFGTAAIGLSELLMDIERASPERIGAAIVLLMLVSCYWTESQKLIEESHLHRMGGRNRLSLKIVAADVRQMETVALPDYLQWVVENYVLKQSAKIAIEKLPDYRYFIVRDDNGYRLVKKQEPMSYLSYDPSRIGSAFALMSELRLVHLSRGYRLTQTGRKILQRLRVRHDGRRATAQSS